MRQTLRHLVRGGVSAALASLALVLVPAPARAAEIILEQTAVLKLLEEALFKRDGRFDLHRAGACYAYLETPSVELKSGRIFIRSHLSSHLGQDISGQCMGMRLASWTVVSGTPMAREGVVRLEDIRIDQIDDPNIRMVVQAGLIHVLPSTLELDVRKSVSEMLKGATGQLETTLERFAFQSVAVQANRLEIRFDFRLVAR